MMKSSWCAIILIIILTCHLSWAVELKEEGKETFITPDKTSSPIKIDGNLDEAVWKLSPIIKTFKTMLPNYGDDLSQETKVWAAYDRENLYFAFMCCDTEPDKIKTSIAQRDNIKQDDLVGILLDAVGNKQSNYEFYINPSGIQWDGITSAVSGPDSAPDFVWDSAGKMIDQGYQVEVRIPLESIRYQGKERVNMRIIFVRQISREGTATWPALDPAQTDFNCQANIIYLDLKGSLKLEVLPNFTYSRDSDRQVTETWQKTTDTNIGVGLKYGLSTSMTVEATINPDFSQVESDVFQVEVNRRYPIFFVEKRPFFMESKEVLDFGIIDQGMMISPIYTRFIVDPGWAAKFSGSAGRMNFAFLAANDRSAGRPWQNSTNPHEGKSAFFGIVRAKYNIGSDNSIGILYSGRHFAAAGERNDVGGIDLKYRFIKDLRLSLSYLYSATRQAEGAPLENGSGWNVMLQYNKPTFFANAAYERYDTDFFMATAFQNRVGISRGWIQLMPRFNMKIKKMGWLRRIAPYVFYSKLHDLGTNMDDTYRIWGLNFGFSPMGEVSIEYRDEDEAWKGKMFDKKYLFSAGSIQLLKWLNLNGQLYIGDQIYYFTDDPFIGNNLGVEIGVTLQPGVKLKVGFNYSYQIFKEKQQNQKVYSVNIYNLHTTYQFNKYFFLRGILRYDSLREILLTDLLASFTLIPGTVVHLGYGSLYLKNQWQGNQWIPGQGDLMKMRQGLFFKASYLFRFR